MFEREAHREKILEARNREIKLKQKQRASKMETEEITEEQKKEILIAELAQAEEEFFTIVEKVILTYIYKNYYHEKNRLQVGSRRIYLSNRKKLLWETNLIVLEVLE